MDSTFCSILRNFLCIVILREENILNSICMPSLKLEHFKHRYYISLINSSLILKETAPGLALAIER